MITISQTICIILGLLTIAAAVYAIKSRIIEKRSITSKIVEVILPLALRANKQESYKDLQRFIIEPRNHKYHIPSHIILTSSIEEKVIDGLRYYRMNPHGKNKNKILYIHGGAYVCEMMDQHLMMLDKIAGSIDIEIIIPIYLLTPEHSHKESYQGIVSLYQDMIAHHNADDIVLMGDSAGGGYSLGLSMYLRDHGIIQPRELILLSPWLDVTMSNPSITGRLSKEDKILDVGSLIDCGVQWAGESNPKDYLISPLFGNFTGLPPITSFVGTSEMFLPDCELLHTRLDKANIKNTLKKYNKMQHVFPALPVPEAKKALKEIVGIIGN